MSRALRSACLFAFVSALAVLSMPGCSQQAEGERCDATNGDTDCNDGLSCIPKEKLLEGITDRCCPAENTESDSRCHRVGSTGIPTSPSGGSSSAGTANSSVGGAAGDSSGGVSALPETGGAAGTPSAVQGGNSSAGMPATTNGGAGGGAAGANSTSGGAGAGGAP